MTLFDEEKPRNPKVRCLNNNFNTAYYRGKVGNLLSQKSEIATQHAQDITALCTEIERLERLILAYEGYPE